MASKRNRINAISAPANAVLSVIFAAFSLTCVFPLLIVLGSSLTSNASIIAHGYNIIPRDFSLYAYTYLFK